MAITVDMIRALRDKTGAGIMDCRNALDEADGDMDQAEVVLSEKGLATASKKAGRETKEGLVEAYIHTGGRVGALIEINCETDFVARTPEMKDLAHDLAMQVAAMPSTSYIDRSEVTQDETRPYEEVSLLDQSYIRDPSCTVNDVIQDVISKVGENIKVGRFARFALGE